MYRYAAAEESAQKLTTLDGRQAWDAGQFGRCSALATAVLRAASARIGCGAKPVFADNLGSYFTQRF